MNERPTLPEMTSGQTKPECIAALLWSIMHMLVLPVGLGYLYLEGYLSEVQANVLVYATGLAFMLLTQFRFLRRDFDAVCERPLRVVAEVSGSYLTFLFINILLSMLYLQVLPTESNPNNEAIAGIAQTATGPTTAMAVYMAPIVEECIFRAGVFGTLRRRNRIAAYIVSALLFSVYHVIDFALAEPIYWVYVLQYLPVSVLMARSYERTDSIWTPIFLHMLVNYISLKALAMF